ncbi:DUF3293 domain-containing protein [Lolliginicoccus suaedae]|uniref:DUF3293 domain-containing protein n=1 Tax=Lolliginicoccus suaedae TaxID=2605429 RepID=UPI0011EEFAA7|nr:DUF3293 domain-containing protein [Lolliginicoccus suaedae]
MPHHSDLAWTPADKLAELAARDDPWKYYLDTVVRFYDGPLVGTVEPLTEGPGGEHPPAGPLHVITAIQPETDPSSPKPTRGDILARMAVLDQELRAKGLHAIRAEGASRNGHHSEESRAVFGLTDQEARQLGLRFGQVAIFAWNGPRWSLLACAHDRATHQAWRWAPASPAPA